MCGITGIFDTRGASEIDRAVLQRMNDSQWHRGPDEGSLHIEPGVGLGHRRLSIIDIATGQQPLFNEDGTVVVVFNGEIYNYQQLIPELQALDAYGFDVVFGGARRDEEKGRAKERIFSFFRGQHPVGIRRPSGQVLV